MARLQQKIHYYLVKWSRICRSRDKGGLGVKDLRKQNISLMVKWWWKLDTQVGLWQDIVKARYLCNKTVATVSPRFSDLPCWKNLLKVRDLYMVGRKIKTESGNLTRLWKDSINGLIPFMEQFPRFFDICTNQECTVDKLCTVNISSFFRRRLDPVLLDQWNDLRKSVVNIQLTGEKDSVYWGLNKTARYMDLGG